MYRFTSRVPKGFDFLINHVYTEESLKKLYLKIEEIGKANNTPPTSYEAWKTYLLKEKVLVYEND